jgi:hypothetical protein
MLYVALAEGLFLTVGYLSVTMKPPRPGAVEA